MRLLSQYCTRRDSVWVGSSTYTSRVVQNAFGPQNHDRATACDATSESVRFHRASKADVSGGTSCLTGAAPATPAGTANTPEGIMPASSIAVPASETSFCLFKTILLASTGFSPRSTTRSPIKPTDPQRPQS